MTTQRSRDVHRADGELVGCLIQSADGLWIPHTVFHAPLGPPQHEERAEEFLLANGLALLAEPWELFLDGHWVTVQLAEVHPGRAIVRCVDYGHPHLFGTLQEWAAPEAATLRRR